MKTESLREVKNNLSRVIEELPETGAVLITKNGKTRAVLIPVDEETDVETIVLSQNRRFWGLFEGSVRSANRKGLTPLARLRA
jgi:prevent-host-death family protein